MKRLIGQMGIVAVIVIAVALAAGAAFAQPVPPGQTQVPGASAITSGPGDKEFPAISGDTVVWLDNTTGSVRVANASSGQTLTIPGDGTNATVAMREVDVSGNYVVWTGTRPMETSTDIYLYDTVAGSLTQVTNDSAFKMSPSVSGNVICWNAVNVTTGRGENHWYGIDTRDSGLLPGNTTSNRTSPAIGGDTVAWLDDSRVGGHFDVLWSSFPGGDPVRVSLTGNISSPPAVSSDGRRVVWLAEEGGLVSLYMAETGTREVRRIGGEGAMPFAPDVDVDYVVWTDYRNGNGDIYLYDIQTGRERQVTSDSAEQVYPAVSGSRIVWMGNDDGAWNIYLAEIGAGQQPTMTGTPAPTMAPGGQPPSYPIWRPPYPPAVQPTSIPTGQPTPSPTGQPTYTPTSTPTAQPTYTPTAQPTYYPTT
ncbi:hypothetical protein [Methanoculleus oceani]|nr:hypothetical protein [Methanoculleus sp. CWC-02]